MAIKNKYVLEFNSKGVKETKSDVDSLNRSQDKLVKNSKKIKAGLAVVGVAIAAMGKHAISTAAQFQTLQTRLNTMYGSVNRGTQAFQKFVKIASTTPFAVKSVVEAGASLKAFGMDAEKNIKGVADLAAFMGVDIVEAAQAMGRAFAGGAGAADVLRERGVLELIKSFKGIEDITKLTLPEFRTALIDAMEDPHLGISGATTALSETFEGNMSNMMDAVDRLADHMGQKLLPAAQTVVKGITGFINSMVDSEDATEKEIAALRTQQNQIRLLTSEIINLNIPQDERVKKIRALQREYPDFLKNMNAEKVTNQDLTRAVDLLNKSTKTRIERLIAEKILAENLADTKRIADALTTSYNAANETAIKFGKDATAAHKDLKNSNNNQFNSIISDHKDFAKSLKTTGNISGAFARTVRQTAERAADLYKQYQDGTLTLDQYTQKVVELGQKQGLLNLNDGKQLQVAREINAERNTFMTANIKLNEMIDKQTEKTQGITDKINKLNEEEENLAKEREERAGQVNAQGPLEPFEIKPLSTGFDPYEGIYPIAPNIVDPDMMSETLATMKEKLTSNLLAMQEEFAHLNVMDMIAGGTSEEREKRKLEIIEDINEINDAIKTIEESTQDSANNSVNFLTKLGKGFGKFVSQVAKDENNIQQEVLDGASALIAAGGMGKEKQIKMQKAMIKANTAKGLIDIWTSPAPSDPLTAAKAIAASAVLVGKASQSNQQLNQALADLKNEGQDTSAKFAEYGMNEVVDGATPIIAGEAGAELVQITPLEGPNTQGPQGQGQIVITGNVMSKDFVEDELVEQLKESIRQGYDFR